MPRRLSAFFLALILGLALFLRSYGLDWGLPHHSLTFRSFLIDEPAMLYPIANFRPAKLQLDPKRPGPGDLLVYATAVGIGAGHQLGWIDVNPSRAYYFDKLGEISKMYLVGRLIVVLLSTASVLLIFFIGRRFYGERVGWICAFLLAILPVHVQESHFYYPHAAVLFFLLLAYLFSCLVLVGGDKKSYLLAGAAGGLAAGTKYDAVFILASVFSAFMIRRLFGNRGELPRLAGSFGVAGIAFFATNPFVLKYSGYIFHNALGMLFPAAAETVESISPAPQAVNRLYYFTIAPIFSGGLPLYLFIVVFIMAGLFMLFRDFRFRRVSGPESSLFLHLILSTAVLAFYYAFQSFHLYYYVVSLFPFMILIAAAGFSRALSVARYRVLLNVLLAAVSLYTAAFAIETARFFSAENVRETASRHLMQTYPDKRIQVAITDYAHYTPPTLQSIRADNPWNVLSIDQKIRGQADTGFAETRMFLPPVTATSSVNERIAVIEAEEPDLIVLSRDDFEYRLPGVSKAGVELNNSSRAFYEYVATHPRYRLAKEFTASKPLFGLEHMFFEDLWFLEIRQGILSPHIAVFERI